MSISIDQLLEVLSTQGPLSSPELQASLRVSQPTVSRLIQRAGNRVVRLGRGRASRYAAQREVPGAGSSADLYAIDESGTPTRLGELTVLAGTVPFRVAAEEQWLLGEGGNGEFPGLPYYLHDLRPQGFLGRQIAVALSGREGAYPGNPELWSDDQVLHYLCRHGADLPGNLIVGNAALNIFLQATPTPVRNRQKEYPMAAARILTQGDPGSSAGGEHPKFTACTEDMGHVIVKFSPAGETPEAARWRDLLIAEYHALSVLGTLGIPVAGCELHQFGDRAYLESRRFDRVGATGRRAAVSLKAVDAEFVGDGEHWIRSARGLRGKGLISEATLDRIRLAHTFGLWIANNDMHLGNLTLAPRRDGFDLHPLYDMLPMRLAPQRGELLEVDLAPPLRNSDNFDVWAQAGEYGARFWQAVSEDGRVSQAMRRRAGEQARRCRAAL